MPQADALAYWTSATYWVLIVCWAIIIVFYLRHYNRLKRLSPLIGVLLIVILVDGVRTLIESLYFGAWYTARTGLIPYRLYPLLSEPQYVVVPKTINLIAALVIIIVIARRWLRDFEREMHRQREIERLYADLSTAHEELKRLSALQDDLTHMIGHDMQNPLAAVIGSLQTLREKDLDLPAGQRDELTGIALAAAQTARARVSDLLDVTRMESGQLTLERAPVTPADLARTAHDDVAFAASETGVALTLDMPADLPAVEVEREMIRRVLVNLLDNAVRASPAGGSVTISARAEPSGAWVRFSVADEGKGVAAEFRERIFEKFVQIETRAGSSRGSFGLGLAFCRLAVEAHGGRIWVESPEGGGATFHFTVPAAPAARAA